MYRISGEDKGRRIKEEDDFVVWVERRRKVIGGHGEMEMPGNTKWLEGLQLRRKALGQLRNSEFDIYITLLEIEWINRTYTTLIIRSNLFTIVYTFITQYLEYYIK
jgi:hypothetical protein